MVLSQNDGHEADRSETPNGEKKMTAKLVTTKTGTVVENPPIARFLFDDTRFAPVWAVVRILLGLSWIDASSHKLGSPDWMQTGVALKGFWTAAAAIPDKGRPP